MKRFVFLTGLFLMLVAVFSYAQETAPAAAAPEKAAPAAAATWSKTITPKTEDTLVVYIDPGNLQIIPTDKKVIVITAQGIEQADQEKIQATSKNREVRLDFRGDKAGNGVFTVQLPAGFNIDSYSSGNVEVQSNLNGKIKIKTNAGSVNMADVDGSLTIDSQSGDIAVGSIKGDASISSNGDIETQDVSGALELKNQSGDSFIKSVGGNANARVADGDLSIGEVGGNLTAQATIGDVDFHKVAGMATVNTDSGDIDFFEGQGMIIAQSNSGDITLRKVAGAVDARTEDGDIDAEMLSGSGNSSKFYTRDGDVDLSFGEGAKATVDAKVTGQGIDEDDEPLMSDFPPVSDKNKLAAKYEINGGGDSIMIEAVNGEISLKKAGATMQPKPAAKPAPKKPN
ncbi:DUF4097 family beta strand repeat-containing protein [bacterium]|nr:DUF4097 family beta strand repeat-containing protein [bacterium]